MTSPSHTALLSQQDQRRIDVAKDAFQSSWQSGRQQRIEEFWQVFPESLRLAALSELLPLEFSLRRAVGDTIMPAEFAERFPEHVELIAELFDQPAPPEKTPSGSSPKVETSNIGQTLLVEREPERPKPAPGTKGGHAKSVPEQLGRYRIERELGRGGMGAVYLAHDGQLDRKVALKIPFFREDDDAEAIERFYREARAMATLQHANLCPVFDVGQFQQWHFLTMAYIDGQPLSKKLKASGTLPLLHAVSLLRTVATAVQKAHEAGIVHRDLKPANIMLNSDLEPIIMDFGLARRRKEGEAELTQKGAILGSPAYMAPEQIQARHDEIGPATDVYALGVILYQMVTGHRPFEGTIASMFGQIVSRQPDPPSRLRPELPPEIDAICLKAIAKSPSQRHASATEFAEDLSQILAKFSDTSPTILIRPGPNLGSPSDPDSDASTASRSRREAELRQVTVAIFDYDADDSGNSGNSSSASELLHNQSQSFLSFVSEQIARLGGVTVVGSGQEVIACFGFPQAFEDAPQRAVRAALQVMRDLAAAGQCNAGLPSPSQAWVVVHSGEAVAEQLGGSQKLGVSLVGDARNTATRLNTIVKPGTIYISATTYQRVALYFECESLGTQQVRGMLQPIELFKVSKEAASRNRVELVDPGNLTPLIGRDTELSVLKDRWEQAREELGQIVLLIGDAGLGKSRLIRELREHVLHDDSERVEVIELRCSQYHQGTSYFPIVEFFSRLLDLENRTAAERLESLVQYLRELKLESPENVAVLGPILSVPTDARFPALSLSPQKLKEVTEDLLLSWLRNLADVSPVLFIVEDLHWIDASTLELLEKHVSQFESGRMLSLLTFRPEFETPWKSKPHQTQIALNRLTKRQVGEMMRKRTHRRDIPEAILQQVIERTDGIPLFIEEFTAVIVESGILDRADAGADAASLLNVIPATLQDLLLSRLDRMAANREVIQFAATIGREFGFRLLAASCTLPEDQLQQELDKLVKAEILFQKGQGTAAGYIFKHALLQDAAYRSMLTKKRQACHLRIAEVLEQQFPETAKAQPELLAQHLTEAGAMRRAVDYWLKAGQKAQAGFANLGAIEHFRKGLQAVAALPESPERDGCELGLQGPLATVLLAARGYAHDEPGQVLERARELAIRLNNVGALFFISWGMWARSLILDQLDTSVTLGNQLLELAEQTGDPGLLMEAHYAPICSQVHRGNFAESWKHFELARPYEDLDRCKALAPHTGQNSAITHRVCAAHARWALGYPDQARQLTREAVRIAEGLNDPFSLAHGTNHASWVIGFCGDAAEMEPLVQRTLTITVEQSFVFWAATGHVAQSHLWNLQGRFKDSIENCRLGMQAFRATGAELHMCYGQVSLAEAHLQLSDFDQALAEAETGLRISREHNELYLEAELLRLCGEIYSRRPDANVTTAEECFREAIGLARSRNSKSWELKALTSLCRFKNRDHRDDESLRELRQCYQWFTEGFDTADLVAAKKLLEQFEG